MSANAPTDAYASAPLPESMTIPGWRVALILASFTLSLPGFLNSAQTGLALGFWPSILAAFLSGVVLCVGAAFTAIVSVRTRLTTYMLVQRSFGIQGAALVNLVMAVIHYCWFGVNVSFLGDALVAAQTQGYGLPGDFNLFVIAGSIVITISTIYGFKTLDRLAMIAVPLVIAILVVVCGLALHAGGVPDFAPAAKPPVPMNFGVALSALVGSNMLAVATMPERGAVAAMVLSFPVATPLLMVISAVIALATMQTDIMQLVVGYGLGAPALAMLLFSVWTMNSLNLYSAGLSMAATFPRVPQWAFTIGGGAVGCVFALMGIIDAFIPFLVTLALIIPPIAAIYVIDGFTIFGRNGSAPVFKAFRWEAIAVWLGSLVVTLPAAAYGLTLTTVPTLDATLLAAAGYLALLRVKKLI
jgi:cytosine permease